MSEAPAETIRVVVADDEELARRLLNNLIAHQRDLTVVGNAENGETAIELVERHQPHLIFLDVMMPGKDGIEVARALKEQDAPPFVVFVTAFDDYAIPAFDLEVLDYLVKPIDRRRFKQTLKRVRTAVKVRRVQQLGEEIASVSNEANRKASNGDGGRHVVVRQRDELIQIAEKDIFWLEAASQYVRIHTESCHYIVAEPLNRYHARLSSDMFVRVHRSAVVNTANVARVIKKKNGVHELRLANGVGVPLSRSRKDMVSEFLGINAERKLNDS